MKQKDWFKDRGYPHFTNRTNIRFRGKVKNYILNSENIAKHSFYPLIYKEIIQRRYKLSKRNGKVSRSHTEVKDDKIVSSKKVRKILYATHLDAHIYSYYTRKLQAEYERYISQNESLSSSITAYRKIPVANKSKFKNNVHFASDVFEEIKKRDDCVVLAFDIENFFPSLDHKLLKRIWTKVLNLKALPPDYYNIYKAVTNFSYVRLEDLKPKPSHFDEKEFAKLKKNGKNSFFSSSRELFDSGITIYKNQKLNGSKEVVGIPQGLPISALLANIYMIPFDESIIKTLYENHKVFYRRYSDDIVIVCDKSDMEDIKLFVDNHIKKINLSISIPKTEITFFEKIDGKLVCYQIVGGVKKLNRPLNYLGFEFYGYQTLLKSKNIAAFYRDMKASIKRKAKRIQAVRERTLTDNPAIFKRKIFRLYSFKGVKPRLIKNRKYRGNYVRYVYKAAEEMNSPEIKRQIRNHWNILQKTIKKYYPKN
ncbi:reverse transcriptase domain-containing protein [Flavobacterium caeni]|uniref:Reverse transcriptase (RNA-dependent DNA polymerase) n=1 Tax=Flavobacterium caeni TaxID=490189 RepID=A0A1G5KFK3_9FLAO|nr:reverse transcriptase domain-containing protein [Flavobacterium caeni]SCY99356.1 Reverse transcriptase (RNA-dependent DNA polymerase) [Flavobacterium caeni]